MSGTFVNVQGRGTIVIPADLRKKYRLDEPGAQVEVISEGDHLILRPMLPVSATQAWFWTAEWQEGERQAEAERAALLGERFDDDEAFIDSLAD